MRTRTLPAQQLVGKQGSHGWARRGGVCSQPQNEKAHRRAGERSGQLTSLERRQHNHALHVGAHLRAQEGISVGPRQDMRHRAPSAYRVAELEQYDSCGVHVGLVVDLTASSLFGTHVQAGADAAGDALQQCILGRPVFLRIACAGN